MEEKKEKEEKCISLRKIDRGDNEEKRQVERLSILSELRCLCSIIYSKDPVV